MSFPPLTAPPSPHAAARMELARKLGAGWAANPKTALVMAAGSTGRGTADEYSDLQLDIYWREPPTADERRQAALAGGAETVEVFPYEDDKWSAAITIQGLQARTRTFLLRTVEGYLAQVAVAGDAARLAQIRLYAIQHGQFLYGSEGLLADWRERAADYPPQLARTMLQQNLTFDGFGGPEDALAARDDVVVLYATFTRVSQQLLGALLGVNRVYLPNSDFKYVADLVDELGYKPADLLARLKSVYRLPPDEGVAALHALISDVFDLVDARVPNFDTRPYRERLAQRDQIWNAPPPA